MSNNTEHFITRISKEMKEQLKELAWKHHMGMSEYVKSLIQREIDKELLGIDKNKKE